jgi:hypothetical protein
VDGGLGDADCETLCYEVLKNAQGVSNKILSCGLDGDGGELRLVCVGVYDCP